MQKLTLPVNNCGVTCGYKNQNYRNYWGFGHYGVDYVSDSLVLYALGTGEVLMKGWDNLFGNIIIIKYPEVYNHATGEVKDLICRMYHMASETPCEVGYQVSRGESIGIMGTTGQYSSGVHVHVEFDTDTKYYNYGVPLAKDSNLIKKGVDSTVDPSDILYVGSNQRVYNNSLDGWATDKELNLPLLDEEPEKPKDPEMNEELKKQLDELASRVSKNEKDIADLYTGMAKNDEFRENMLKAMEAVINGSN